ncbi:hypothetical protein FE251_12385 [Georgenia wutianyii]|uniref:Ferritin-like domain-containing protein n=2 Tax=Georgenia wutianyii TaxID=2585135 RepID=A0ABX5VPE1_9MICO|nr:hypothetical protein FE251_12385 [Georgenia wutianyii]
MTSVTRGLARWSPVGRTYAGRMPNTPPSPPLDGREGPASVLALLGAGDLVAFSWLSADADLAPALGARESLARAAAERMGHYDVVAAMLDEAVGTHEGVTPYLGFLEEVGGRMEAMSWEEQLLRTAVMGGMVHDLGDVLAQLLPAEQRERVMQGASAPDDVVIDLMAGRLSQDEPLRARLSLWGRRVAGEALAVLPAVVAQIADAAGDRREAVTALQAPAAATMSSRHAQRMERLGLAA